MFVLLCSTFLKVFCNRYSISNSAHPDFGQSQVENGLQTLSIKKTQFDNEKCSRWEAYSYDIDQTVSNLSELCFDWIPSADSAVLWPPLGKFQR